MKKEKKLKELYKLGKISPSPSSKDKTK